MTKVYLVDDEKRKFFGEGPYRLLLAVKETGSLRAAALSMDMAYTKALKLLRQAESALGFPLTQRSTGGKDGGGSKLTPECLTLLDRYRQYREACVQANCQLYAQFFPTGDGR